MIRAKWAGGIAKTVEHLPIKYEALTSNSSTIKKKSVRGGNPRGRSVALRAKEQRAAATVIADFSCQHDWIKGSPDTGKVLFLGVSVRHFWKRMAFESVD
jgi:hypothetical protein